MWTFTTLCLCLFLPLASCLQWATSPNDAITLTACLGSDVTFPWEFALDQGDVLYNTEWLFNGPPQALLAFNSHGSFVTLPEFAGRLVHGTTGGLTLRHVTLHDRGNYSIEVNGIDASGTSFRLTRTVFVNVTELLLTADNPLHLEAKAVRDDTTGQWSLQLQCGDFVLDRLPQFSVQYHTPAGKLFSSTGYRDGHFLLSLPSPLESGQYTCLIPDHFAGMDCLPTNLTTLGRATLFLDSVDARLELLEAQQTVLHEENSRLKTENEHLKDRLTTLENRTAAPQAGNASQEHHDAYTKTQAMIQNLTEVVGAHSNAVDNLIQVVDGHSMDLKNLTGSASALHQDVAQNSARLGLLENGLENINASSQSVAHDLSALSQEIHMLEAVHMQDKIKLSSDIADLRHQVAGSKAVSDNFQTVSFHAQLDHNTDFRNGQSMVLSVVYNNNGNAYDNSTGIFTAPADGTYFFIASTGSFNRTHDAYLELVADGQPLSLAFAHSNSDAGEMATCHAVTSMRRGQRVWLRSMLNSYFNYADTFFSGFLV